MSNETSIIINSSNFFTILAIIVAILIAIISGIKKHFSGQIKEQKLVIDDIDSLLSFYANIYTQLVNNPKDYKKAGEEFREKATKLKSKSKNISRYNIHSKFSYQDISIAYENLIGLSNTLYRCSNYENTKNNLHVIDVIQMMDNNIKIIKEKLKLN